MGTITIELAIGLGGVMAGAIGILWRQLLIIQKELSISEKEKLDMVLKEAKNARDIALQAMEDKTGKEQMLNILNRIEQMIQVLSK